MSAPKTIITRDIIDALLGDIESAAWAGRIDSGNYDHFRDDYDLATPAGRRDAAGRAFEEMFEGQDNDEIWDQWGHLARVNTAVLAAELIQAAGAEALKLAELVPNAAELPKARTPMQFQADARGLAKAAELAELRYIALPREAHITSTPEYYHAGDIGMEGFILHGRDLAWLVRQLKGVLILRGIDATFDLAPRRIDRAAFDMLLRLKAPHLMSYITPSPDGNKKGWIDRSKGWRSFRTASTWRAAAIELELIEKI